MKKKTIIVLDTETLSINQTDKVEMHNNLPYQIGYAVVTPCDGATLLTRNYVIQETFFGMPERMKSAYYAHKIPLYYEAIAKGEMKVEGFFKVMAELHRIVKEYDVCAICAHNARFDVDALNTLCEVLSGYRCALPNVEIWDSMKMVKTFTETKAYTKFCDENKYKTGHRPPRNRMTAEIIYRFISGDNDFVEEHTALEDVKIECEIIFKAYRTHKKMERVLYKKWEEK